MTRPAGMLFSTIALALGFAVLASSAEAAKSRHHKKHAASAASSTKGQHRTASSYRGQNLVQSGPLYFGPDYLGDDPDPNIRFQILRDITGRFGGGGD